MFFKKKRPSRTLQTDVLLCGQSGGKYNDKWFFYLFTNEGEMIISRASLTVVDNYSHTIRAINYGASPMADNYPDLMDLKETMKGLE